MPKMKRIYIKQEDLTWFQAFDIYLEEKERVNLSEQTVVNYVSSFKKYNRAFGLNEQSSLTEATEYSLEDFIDKLRAENLKPDTINSYVRNINHFLKWMFERNFIKDYEKTIELKVEDTLPRFLSEDEVDALVSSPYNRNNFTESRSYTIICLMLSIGIRVGSVPEIHVSDWDRDNGILTLRKTKTRKQQLIYLPSSTSEILDRYYYDYIKGSHTEYLFPNSMGEKITVNGLQRAHMAFCAARGVENKGLHSLRHTCAYYYIRNGGNIYRLKKMLNHRDISSTMRYGRLFDEDVAEDFQKINILNDVIGTKTKITKRRKV